VNHPDRKVFVAGFQLDDLIRFARVHRGAPASWSCADMVNAGSDR
jgi:hypothetical protein